jgi:D-psicose/D-tagatose/L-ribulose 3-epimerase
LTNAAKAGERHSGIQIGIISFMWARPFTETDYDLVDRARTLGFEAFELVMPEPESINFSVLGQHLDASGISSALTARVDEQTDPSSDDPLIRERARKYLRYCIDAAAEMGAGIVGGPLLGSPLVFAGRRPRPITVQERQQRFDRCVRHLTELAPYAQERSVKLAVEPVNRFETDTINLVEQALEFLEAVDADDVIGVLLDTFHANIEEESVTKAIETAGSRLIHIHANENHRGVIGTGHLPWPEIMRTLERIHYRGQVILEPFRRDDRGFSAPLASWRSPKPEEDQHVAQSLQYLRSLLRADHHESEA